jgi:hypothetical protein
LFYNKGGTAEHRREKIRNKCDISKHDGKMGNLIPTLQHMQKVNDRHWPENQNSKSEHIEKDNIEGSTETCVSWDRKQII